MRTYNNVTVFIKIVTGIEIYLFFLAKYINQFIRDINYNFTI